MSLIKDIDQIFTCNNIIKNHFLKNVGVVDISNYVGKKKPNW